MNRKIKFYILLSTTFIIGALIVQIFAHTIADTGRENLPSLPEISEQLIDTPLFRLVFATYSLFFLVGLGIGVVWLLRVAQKGEVFSQSDGIISLGYSHEYNLKIITFTTAAIFFATLAILALALLRQDPHWPRVTVFYNIFLEIATLLILFRYLKPHELGIRKDHVIPLKAIGLYTITLWLIFPSAFINHYIVSTFNIQSDLNPDIPLYLILKDDPARYLLLFQIIILGPVVEELFFRGFLYGWLRKNFSFVPAALLVSLIFAFIHRTYNVVFPLFILSFMLCYLYERTHSIANSILFHSLHNFLGCIVLFAITKNSY